TAAAARLGVAKSVCSRRVSELETDLSAQLVNRTTRSVVATQAGLTYYQSCLEVLALLEDANQAAKCDAKVVSGRLKLSLPIDYCQFALLPKLESFAKGYPDAQLTLDLSDGFVDLISGGFDAAVRIGKLSDSTLYARKIGEMRLICCASPEYLAQNGTPKDVDDLSNHQCLLYSNAVTGSEWVFFKDGVEIRKRVQGRFSANNGTHQKTLALNHHGIVYIPDFIGKNALDCGDLVQVLGDYDPIPTDIQVVFPEKKNMRAVLRAFIDHLTD
ncbi:MAG: LysR family transcriptional regulator, partial [Proteobacteria bacterium]|nr:LysR family transcriptional regulator [Pseudomonadota bacterium]